MHGRIANDDGADCNIADQTRDEDGHINDGDGYDNVQRQMFRPPITQQIRIHVVGVIQRRCVVPLVAVECVIRHGLHPQLLCLFLAGHYVLLPVNNGIRFSSFMFIISSRISGGSPV